MAKNLEIVNVNDVVYVNTTPHEINCMDAEGNMVVIPPCGTLVNARPLEREVRRQNGVTYVTTVFEPSEEGIAFLDELEAAYPGAVVIGSIIAAQAYPGRVCGLTPCPGYERVAPSEKRMRLDKFTIFVK